MPKLVEDSLISELYSQRLNSVKLSHWLGALPGPKARQALLALGDLSSFLDLPPSEIPSGPAPDPAAQHRMLLLCQNYIDEAIRQLPDLFATRVTTSYQKNLWDHWTADSGSHPLRAFAPGGAI